MERDLYPGWIIQGLENFNSHAHVERDYCAFTILVFIEISTHTLTWSVTILVNLQLDS